MIEIIENNIPKPNEKHVHYKKTDVQPKEEDDPNFVMPDLYDTKVVQQMIIGTYEYKGVKIGDTLAHVEKTWGPLVRENVKIQARYKTGIYKYGNNVSIVVNSENPHIDESKMKVSIIRWHTYNKEYNPDLIPEFNTRDVQIMPRDGRFRRYWIGTHLHLSTSSDNGNRSISYVEMKK